jgi:hypothetical protein
MAATDIRPSESPPYVEDGRPPGGFSCAYSSPARPAGSAPPSSPSSSARAIRSSGSPARTPRPLPSPPPEQRCTAAPLTISTPGPQHLGRSHRCVPRGWNVRRRRRVNAGRSASFAGTRSPQRRHTPRSQRAPPCTHTAQLRRDRTRGQQPASARRRAPNAPSDRLSGVRRPPRSNYHGPPDEACRTPTPASVRWSLGCEMRSGQIRTP